MTAAKDTSSRARAGRKAAGSVKLQGKSRMSRPPSGVWSKLYQGSFRGPARRLGNACADDLVLPCSSRDRQSMHDGKYFEWALTGALQMPRYVQDCPRPSYITIESSCQKRIIHLCREVFVFYTW